MGDLGFFLVGAAITIGMVVAIRKLGGAKGGADWMLAWVCIILSGLDRMLIPDDSAFAFITPAWDTLFAGFLISGTLRYVGQSRYLTGLWFTVAVCLVLRCLSVFVVEQETFGTICATIGISAASVVCTWLVYTYGQSSRQPVVQVLSAFFLLPAVAQGNYAAIQLTQADLSAAYFMWLVAGAGLCIVQVTFLVDAARRAANVSRETLALMAEAAPVGLCLTSPGGTVRAVNAKAETLLKRGRYLGERMSDILGKPAAELPPPGAAATLASSSSRSLRVQSHELIVEGEHVADVWFIEDVSSDKILQSMMPRAQYLESLRTMSGNIAHIFNNHLAVILGHAELLQSGEPSAAEKHIKSLVDATMRCAEVTKDFLLLTHGDVDGAQDMAVVPALQELSHEQSIVCRIQADAASHVVADNNQFRRVFREIFDNARDAGATSLDVVAEEREPGLLTISVRDNGRGIAGLPAERVFEPFFSTKGVGSGLGLSVVRGIVSAHGGDVELVELGDGVELVTTWPIG